MSAGENKCAACGQWAGHGHRCPTTAPPTTPPPADVPRTIKTSTRRRAEVENRVQRGNAAIPTSPQPSYSPTLHERYAEAVSHTDQTLDDIRETLSPSDDHRVAQAVASPLWEARRYAESEGPDSLKKATEYAQNAKRGAASLTLNDYEAERQIKTLLDNLPEHANRVRINPSSSESEPTSRTGPRRARVLGEN